MVLQLAHHVQNCLHKHNKPQLSFYDKMMANKRKEEERILAAEQQKLRKEIEANKEREEDEVRRIYIIINIYRYLLLILSCESFLFPIYGTHAPCVGHTCKSKEKNEDL